jgi:signal peptidase II
MNESFKIITKDKRLMAYVYLRYLIVQFLIIAVVITADLVFKTVFAEIIKRDGDITVIENFFTITYSENDGAAFGILDGQWLFFIIITPIELAAVIFILFKSLKNSAFLRCALALFIGGTAGNFVDRLIFHYVRDFFWVQYLGHEIFGSTSFAIFNIADAALTVSVIMLIVYFLFLYRDPKDVRFVLKTGGKIPREESVETYLARTEKTENDRAE